MTRFFRNGSIKAFVPALVVSILILGFTTINGIAMVPTIAPFRCIDINLRFSRLLDFVIFFPALYGFFHTMLCDRKSVLLEAVKKSTSSSRERQAQETFSLIILFFTFGSVACVLAFVHAAIFPMVYWQNPGGIFLIILIEIGIALLLSIRFKLFLGLSYALIFFVVYIVSIKGDLAVFLYSVAGVAWFLFILNIIFDIIDGPVEKKKA